MDSQPIIHNELMPGDLCVPEILGNVISSGPSMIFFWTFFPQQFLIWLQFLTMITMVIIFYALYIFLGN